MALHAAAVEILIEKGRFEPEVALGIAEAIEGVDDACAIRDRSDSRRATAGAQSGDTHVFDEPGSDN
jgi:hypothetical protein